jgi:hypothetical protein
MWMWPWCWPMELAGSFDGPLLMPIVLSRSELDHLRAREDMLAQSLDREGVAVALATEAATTTPRAGSTTLRFT